MRLLLPRVLPAGRRAVFQSTCKRTTLSQQCSLLPQPQIATATFKAKINYKPDPLAIPTDPRSKTKSPKDDDTKKRVVRQFSLPPPTKTPEELATLPYIVRRTPYAQLPVYRSFKSGGNRIVVLIKKVAGNRLKMIEDLTEALQLEGTEIRLNPTTQHVEVKVGDILLNREVSLRN